MDRMSDAARYLGFPSGAAHLATRMTEAEALESILAQLPPLPDPILLSFANNAKADDVMRLQAARIHLHLRLVDLQSQPMRPPSAQLRASP